MKNGTVAEKKTEKTSSKKYEPQNFERLLGTPGFSDKLLKDHFKLYEGYVNNTNAVLQQLADRSKEGKDRTPEFAELKRRFGWEFNGMRLHELYFGNMGGKESLDEDSPLGDQLVASFGSVDQWKRDFVSTGSMRGIGWVILYQDSANGRLFNNWIEEHQGNHLVTGKPLLIMDVFEHAFLTDYGVDRAKYISAFLNTIDWSAVYRRVDADH